MKARMSAQPSCGVEVTTDGGGVEMEYIHNGGSDFSFTITDMQYGQPRAIHFIPSHTNDPVFHCLRFDLAFGVEVELRSEICGHSFDRNMPLVITAHLRKEDDSTGKVIYHRVYLTKDGEWKDMPNSGGMPEDALRLNLLSAEAAIKARKSSS